MQISPDEAHSVMISMIAFGAVWAAVAMHFGAWGFFLGWAPAAVIAVIPGPRQQIALGTAGLAVGWVVWSLIL